jgi:rubrerythrin
MNDEPIHQEIQVPPPETRTAGMLLIWRCTNCGNIFDQHEDIPDHCPNCGKPKEYYEQMQED